jgi:hypothetical protein
VFSFNFSAAMQMNAALLYAYALSEKKLIELRSSADCSAAKGCLPTDM